MKGPPFGIADGDAAGALVGFSVRDLVGSLVGNAEGYDVGALVGISVGGVLGVLDGIVGGGAAGAFVRRYSIFFAGDDTERRCKHMNYADWADLS